jgi:hypothetical protein
MLADDVVPLGQGEVAAIHGELEKDGKEGEVAFGGGVRQPRRVRRFGARDELLNREFLILR